jgi:5-methyltetrahydrofolate--homocysteine methyltransferase
MKKEILNKSHIVADGAWGTEFLKLGLGAGGCPEEWNLTHSDQVKGVAKAYVDAGSQIILTNTFGANTNILERYNLLDKMEEINKRGAEISRSAANEDTLVFGSIGPYGRIISMDETTDEEVEKSVTVQFNSLFAGGVDGIALETMTDLAELVVSIKAIKSINSDVPVVASMSYDSGPDQQCTMMGVTPQEAVAECINAGADIIGANCGLGIDNSIAVCKELRRNTDLPIWVKANAGFPELVGDQVVYSMDAEGFSGFVPALIKAGANIIGGCCGTDSSHIKAIAARV